MFQASVFGVGLFYCAKNGGLKTCPSLGDRYEQTFAVMIATTLALLTGKHDKLMFKPEDFQLTNGKAAEAACYQR